MEEGTNVAVLFANGTSSHQAVRAIWIADARGQLRVIEAETIAELVEMLEWWRRVRETPEAVCAVAANKRA